MGTRWPETCWATYKGEINLIPKVTSSWSLYPHYTTIHWCVLQTTQRQFRWCVLCGREIIGERRKIQALAWKSIKTWRTMNILQRTMYCLSHNSSHVTFHTSVPFRRLCFQSATLQCRNCKNAIDGDTLRPTYNLRCIKTQQRKRMVVDPVN